VGRWVGGCGKRRGKMKLPSVYTGSVQDILHIRSGNQIVPILGLLAVPSLILVYYGVSVWSGRVGGGENDKSKEGQLRTRKNSEKVMKEDIWRIMYKYTVYNSQTKVQPNNSITHS